MVAIGSRLLGASGGLVAKCWRLLGASGRMVIIRLRLLGAFLTSDFPVLRHLGALNGIECTLSEAPRRLFRVLTIHVEAPRRLL